MTGPDGEETVDVRGPMSADDLPVHRARRHHGERRRTAAARARAGAGVEGGAGHGSQQVAFTVLRSHVVLPSAAFVPTRVALLRDFLVEHLTRELAAIDAQCSKHLGAAQASGASKTKPRKTGRRP